MNFDSIMQSYVSGAIAMVNRAFDSASTPKAAPAVKRGRGRPPHTASTRIESMLRDGKHHSEITQATGASYNTVNDVRRRIGVPARGRGPSRRPHGETKRLIIEALKAGKGPAQIVSEVGCAAPQISRERRLLGLPPFLRGFHREVPS